MPPRASVRLRPVGEAPLRALGLVRVSKARDDMISPELQRTAIEDHAVRRGYQVVRWMEGLDESASRDRSPWWRRLEDAVGMVEAREVDVILVWKVSRAARHRRRWAVALDRIEVAGGMLESATEGLDATTSTGRLARGMLAELAAWEADVKSEQWKEAQARRLRMGLPHTGGPRFGYVYDRATGYSPDPERGVLLRSLYERYVAGEGFQQLAVALNRGGVSTLRGGRWTPTTVMRQLDSGFGAGFLQLGTRKGARELVRGAHPAVVDDALWRAYLGRRQRLQRLPARSRSPIYPLTGLVRCGLCGSALLAWSKPDRRGVVQRGYLYRCSGWRDGLCRGVWVKRASVEAAVLEQIAGWTADLDARAATKSARAASRAVARADRARLLREQQRVARALTQLVVAQAKDPDVPASVYASARVELLAEAAELVSQLAAVSAQEESLGARVSELAGLLAEWDELAPAARRDVLGRFVERVEVSRDASGGVVVVVVPVGGHS